ncbi:hypothetical protein C2E23DRAFT_886554 [Lenzites betulinus]|nr:hypothetical protein C2E23DRAFT_886554 [Lenzites betulinus]
MFFKPSPTVFLTFLAALSAAPAAHAGPLAYGICQTGCNALVVACYAGAGAVFGTVTAGVGTPAAIVACNVALGQCSAACALIVLAPTP